MAPNYFTFQNSKGEFWGGKDQWGDAVKLYPKDKLLQILPGMLRRHPELWDAKIITFNAEPRPDLCYTVGLVLKDSP